MKKQFTEKSFTFFTINFIVGIGFITTISTVVKMSYWGYLVLVAAAFLVFGITLVFSRLSNTYNDHYGGSYAFARHIDADVANGHRKKSKNKFINNLIFFVGWNQFIQTPLLSAIAPLLLTEAILKLIPTDINSYETIKWVVRVSSIVIFLLIIALSTIGLKTNKKIIYLASAIKWVLVVTAFAILIFALSYHAQLPEFRMKNTKTGANQTISPYLIITNTLLFMYAFGGIEDAASMVKDVKFTNFKKILFVAFGFIFTFYLIFFSVYLFLPENINGKSLTEGFYSIYNYGLGSFGLAIFIIGFMANDLGYKLFQSVSTARKVVPLAQDDYLFESLKYRNKHGEFKNAIVFSTIIVIISMLTLWLIPTILFDKEEEKLGDFFNSTIIASSIALLIEDLITFSNAFILSKKRLVPKIPIWEKTIYAIVMTFISFIVLSFFVPWILGSNWESTNTYSILIYFTFVLIGFALKLMHEHQDKLIKWFRLTKFVERRREKYKNYHEKPDDFDASDKVPNN
ncbi:APC family permease [Mycoplasma sp. Pen4]|uniref:APC family permease n=1 Tax=Mycoplasma sp. Pen4 TaxID=640330 RepID=UPI0016544655|nr:APC family permease [Mycoplasma sp. Pen4]QNM93548.1 APC family permease [Mycoplasma sp. Pen4]